MSEIDRELVDIEEALQAANVALDHLYAAQEKLGSASKWGIVDIMGGGMLVTYVKRRKMKDASYEIEAAQRALGVFNRELKDVRHIDIELEVSGFTEFADYFFDNSIMDFFAQSRISDARSDVKNAITRVENLVDQLEDRQEELVDQLSR